MKFREKVRVISTIVMIVGVLVMIFKLGYTVYTQAGYADAYHPNLWVEIIIITLASIIHFFCTKSRI